MGNYWKMLVATNFHKKLENYRFWQPWGEHFFRSRPICDQSLRPTWVPEQALGRNFRRIFATFWLTGESHVISLRSRKLGESANTNWGYPRDPLEWILRGFFRILCVALVIRCVQVLFQLRPKFVQIPDQLLLCR